MISRPALIKSEHKRRFTRSRAVVRFGTTPALRGRFTSAAARITLEGQDFTKFYLIHEAISNDLAQKLQMHRSNIAFLSENAIGSENSSLSLAKLFDDAGPV